MKPLHLGSRPTPSEKRGIIKFVVDEIKKVVSNADMEQTRMIARKMVATYPKSFEDRADDGDRLGCGFYTVAKLLKTRIEYTNRGNLTLRLRQAKSKKGSADAANQAAPNRAPAQYGCINWQPREYPEDETDETLNAKMTELVQLAANQGTTLSLHKDMIRIDRDMTATYIIQRRLINSNPPVAIEQIEAEWPFLFVDRWLFQHFQQLVGKPPYSTLRESLSAKGNRILRFFLKEGDAVEVRLVEQHHQDHVEDSGVTPHNSTSDTHENDIAATILRLIMHRFKENVESLFVLADVSKKRQTNASNVV